MNTAKAKKDKIMSKKTTKTEKAMTYPQAIALTNAYFHAGFTVAEISERLDKMPTKGKGMDEAKKAKWLEEHGQEPASYAQCRALSFALLNNNYPYNKISQLIDNLDKKSGYVRQGKAEKTAKAEKAEKAVKNAETVTKKADGEAKAKSAEQASKQQATAKTSSRKRVIKA